MSLGLSFDRKTFSWTGRMKRDRNSVVIAARATESPERGQKTPAPALLARIELAASKALAELDEHVGEVAPHFVDVYEKHWRGSSRRARPTPAELAKRFVLARVDIHDAAEYTLRFREASLFAKHRPSISVMNGRISDARLERPIGKNGQLVGRFDMHHILPVGRNAPKPAPRRRPLAPRKRVTPRWLTPLAKTTAGWTGAIKLAGRTVAVAGDSPTSIDERLGALLGMLPDIVARAARELVALYNGAWREGARLTAAKLAGKIELQRIAFDATSWTLLFADGGLFGGHVIEVFDIADEVRTNLLG